MVLLDRAPSVSPFELKNQIQKLAWEKVGVIRSSSSLMEALASIQDIKEALLPRVGCKAKEKEYNREWVEAIQAANLLTTLEAIAKSASERRESRGAHYRKDIPFPDDCNWLKNIVISNENGEMTLEPVPVQGTRYSVPGN